MTTFASPSNELEIREAVLQASTQKTSLRIIAGGTRSGIGNPGSISQALDVANVSGITRYEPGSLTIEAKSGTPMSEIEAALAKENQMLAFEPMDHRALMGTTGTPTIGGIVACNVSGPRRFLSGACRDFALGVRFIDGHGRVIKNGGRVMKNVTGLDLTKLTCGAYGTLGVISEIALKVLPKPECGVTLQFEGLNVDQAVKLFCQAVTTPFEISGAAWQNNVALLRIEGLPKQVSYRLSRLQDLFSEFPSAVIEGNSHSELWNDIRDVQAFSDTDETIWKVSTKPTQTPAIVTASHDLLQARSIVDQGAATIWLAVPSDAPEQAETIRGLIPNNDGYATLIRGSRQLRKSVPVFQPQHARIEQISENLRRQFDPMCLLNPGLMAA